MRNDVLVVEISGKRPGDVKARPTEKFVCSYPHIIISNNSDGYETDWDIVNVPDDYKDWYCANIKTSDNAWYAPMNRSYAIKYAWEHGYRYLVQLDDNIKFLEIGYQISYDDYKNRYRVQSRDGMLDDFVDMMCCVLENTNAAMAGCALAGVAAPDDAFLRERYCYSIFTLDVDRCPDVFQGDFEDDVEFRLKLAQMGLPTIQIAPLRYSKTGQEKNKDLSGCRKEYAKVGVKRGEHMRKLYGKRYSCGMRGKSNCIRSEAKAGEAYFKHILAPYKLGVIIRDKQAVDDEMKRLLQRWAKEPEDRYIIKTKKKKG